MTEPAPVDLLELNAPAEWMDFNGHMNVASYVMSFDRAMDVFLDRCGLGQAYAEQKAGSVFALQNHIHYLKEVKESERVSITLQMLDVDEKRLHVFLRMFNKTHDYLAATSELLAIHVDMAIRSSSAFPQPARQALTAILEKHQQIRRPALAGRGIGTRVKM